MSLPIVTRGLISPPATDVTTVYVPVNVPEFDCAIDLSPSFSTDLDL